VVGLCRISGAVSLTAEKTSRAFATDDDEFKLKHGLCNIGEEKNSSAPSDAGLSSTPGNRNEIFDEEKSQKFLKACEKKNFKEFMCLIADPQVNINYQDNELMTPLLWTSWGAQTEMARMLIDKGVNFNLKDKYGTTPLYYFIFKNNTEIARILIDKGADFNLRDKDGTTPLHWAACEGYPEMFQMLIDKGADFNLKDNDGKTPLDHAWINKNFKATLEAAIERKKQEASRKP
jgi:ankyrin repeat protein